jgi:peptide/nickel transport system substrate-binding protein
VALSTTTSGRPPFDILTDRSVRLAINHAVDRDEIVRVAWKGLGQTSPGIVPELSKTRGYEYAPAKAERLLDEAGWTRGENGVRTKGGRTLGLRLIAGFPDSQFFGQMPELVQGQLERVGIKTEIVRVSDSGVYYDHYMKEGQGDLWLESGMNRTGDPTYLLFNLYHSGSEWVWYRWLAAGPAFDRSLDEARRAKTLEEGKAWVAEASRVLVDEEASIVPIAMLPNFYAGSKRVKAFTPHSLFGLDRYSEIQMVQG